MACSPVTLAVFLIISGEALTSAQKFCSMYRYGKLTQFVPDGGTGNNVEVPCKYILADFVKGGYRVVVTARNNLDPDYNYRFTPDWLKVEIVDQNSSQSWVAETDSIRLETAELGSADVWDVETSGLTPSRAKLNHSRFAIVEMNEVFKVTFAKPNQESRGIEVKVYGAVTSSRPYPETLCGSTDSGVSFSDLQDTLFGSGQASTRSMVYTYNVLNENGLTQSPTCNDIAQTFQTCPAEWKGHAIRICSDIYSRRSLSQCLMNPADPEEHFNICLRAVCTSL